MKGRSCSSTLALNATRALIPLKTGVLDVTDYWIRLSQAIKARFEPNRADPLVPYENRIESGWCLLHGAHDYEFGQPRQVGQLFHRAPPSSTTLDSLTCFLGQ